MEFASLVFFLLEGSLVNGPFVHATIFSPNCTLPSPAAANFVASPNTRGTLSIVRDCLSIIILCTWNIQHLNIPSRRPYYDDSGRRYGWLRSTWWKLLDLRTDLAWMLLTMLVPEYIVGKALSERLAAVSSLETLKSRFGEEIEIVHAYIMNMGGFYLDFSETGFYGWDISKTEPSHTSGLSSTAVDYSGIYFSNSHPGSQLAFGKSKISNESGRLASVPELSSEETKPVKVLGSLTTPVCETEQASVQSLHNTSEPDPRQAPVSPRLSNKVTSRSDSSTASGKMPQAIPSVYPVKQTSGEPSHSSEQQLPISDLSSFQLLNMSRFAHEKWTLTALQLLSAKGFKLFDFLPVVSPQELESLNSSSNVVKFLAITQIVWLVTQLGVRYKWGIVSSQLEIATVAFAICSMLTYALIWDRPRGVTTRYQIKAKRAPTLDEAILLATFGPGYLWTWHRLEQRPDEELNLAPIPNDASHAVDVRSLVAGFENTAAARTLIEWLRHNHPAIVSVIVGSVIGGTLFGGLHCLAWNFNFPSRAEMILWRVSAILTTVLPVCSVYFNVQWSYYNGRTEPGEDTMLMRIHGPILLLVFIVPYVVARLFLLVETFRSLFFLPPEAFIATWPGAVLLWG